MPYIHMVYSCGVFILAKSLVEDCVDLGCGIRTGKGARIQQLPPILPFPGVNIPSLPHPIVTFKPGFKGSLLSDMDIEGSLLWTYGDRDQRIKGLFSAMQDFFYCSQPHSLQKVVKLK